MGDGNNRLACEITNFSICPSSRSFLISVLTRYCKLMRTLLPFWCFGWKFWWNFDLTMCIFERPIRVISWGNCFAIRVLNGHWDVIVLTILPPIFGIWVTEIPRASNRSLPTSGFNPSRTTTNSASGSRHSLLAIGACIIPVTFMGSFENVLSSWGGAIINHRARGEFSTISEARDLGKILHTLPESMRSPTWVLPICKMVLFGSICIALLAMLATILSSELS